MRPRYWIGSTMRGGGALDLSAPPSLHLSPSFFVFGFLLPCVIHFETDSAGDTDWKACARSTKHWVVFSIIWRKWGSKEGRRRGGGGLHFRILNRVLTCAHDGIGKTMNSKTLFIWDDLCQCHMCVVVVAVSTCVVD